MFSRAGSAIFVPDGAPPNDALRRTTHLGVAAHADDLEIMAIHGILACYERAPSSFTGVIVTDGTGSPQGHAALDAETLRDVRRHEQEQAAELGKYGAVVFLDHPSADVKDQRSPAVVNDLRALLRATRPEVVYTHALSDVHDTHVGVTLRLLDACRELGPAERPQRVLGCEVWRDLDWLTGIDKVALPVDEHSELQAALLRCFTSQLATKGIDRGTLGRRVANAAFSESHRIDSHAGLVWAMDLTPLLLDGAHPREFLRNLVRRLEDDVIARLDRLSS
jgi:LmbE family N-acetylglucosaminyl deacetylase